MKKMLVVLLLFLALAPSASAQAESGKLDQILEKQDRILRTLEEIKSELQVVKVRSTK